MSVVYLALFLEKRTPLKDGTFPAKLRLTYNRERKYYGIKVTLNNGDVRKVSLSTQEFEQIMDNNLRPKGELRKIKEKIEEERDRARSIIDEIKQENKTFSFAEFERRYIDRKKSKNDVYSLIEDHIKNLKKEGRVGYADTFNCCINSLKKFKPGRKLRFEDITVNFLNEYEQWMVNENQRTSSTVGFYLRALRVVFNMAIKKRLTRIESYPFADKNRFEEEKYTIPASRNIKKPLTKEELELIKNYNVIEGSREHMYRDYFLFCYFANGMNVKDMARLKYKHMDSETIMFFRKKSERTTKKSKRQICVIRNETLNKIVEMWGNKPEYNDEYIFPIFRKDFSPKQELDASRQTIKMINKYNTRIASAVGIKKKVTSGVARHSYANRLKDTGAPLDHIMVEMGHSNVETTRMYLADMNIDVKRKYAEKL